MTIYSSQVPQADKIEVLFKTVQAVAEGCKTYDQITKYIGDNAEGRHGRYYRLAAQNLGLINAIEKNNVSITDTGSALLSLPENEQKNMLLDLLLQDAFFSRFIRHFINKPDGFTKQDAIQFIESIAGLKHSTSDRRFISVKAWLLYLEVLKEENRRFVFVKELQPPTFDEEDSENFYSEESNTTESVNIPEGPVPIPEEAKKTISKRRKRNPKVAKLAIELAQYSCEIDPHHHTFTHKKSGKRYMEPHHLIPMEFQGLFDVSIDVPENIVSLCPNCHQCLHRAKDNERVKNIEGLYKERMEGLETRGINIGLDELMELYGADV